MFKEKLERSLNELPIKKAVMQKPIIDVPVEGTPLRSQIAPATTYDARTLVQKIRVGLMRLETANIRK